MMRSSQRLKTLALSSALLMGACATPPAQKPLSDAPPSEERYAQELLDLALQKGGLSWPRNDNLHTKSIDVRWGDQASPGYEAVNVAVLRGLNDYWVALIRTDDQSEFDKIRHWWDLTCLTGASLVTEPVGQAFQAHKVSTRILPTDTDPDDWLSQNKADFVMIPAAEIDHWLDKSKGRYTLEQGLAFYHHQPYQFQVVKADTPLADYLRLGLVVAEKDGSFEDLYKHHYQGLLNRLQLTTRRIFKLPHHGQTKERFIRSACKPKA